MRGRIVVVALALIAFALIAGSVLVIGYAAAAASLLMIVTLIVEKALRGRSVSPTQSPVPQWIDADERAAA